MSTIELTRGTKTFLFPAIFLEILFLSLLAFASFKEYELYFLIGIISIPFLLLFFYEPKIWVYVSILMFAPILALRDEGVSPIEIAFSVVVILGLVIYFFYKFFIEKKSIVENYGDLFILLFFVFLPFNGLVAYLNDVDLFYWLREVLILLLILLYFPIREYFTDLKDFNRLLFFVMIVSLACSIYIIVTYKESTLVLANYAYELFGLAGTKKVNHIVFVGTYFTALLLAQNSKKLPVTLLLFFSAFLSLVALIITVSRTFWIATILGTIVLFIYFNWKERIKLIVFYFLILSLFVGFAYFTFHENYRVVTKLIEYRFFSSLKGKQDRSLQSRFAEYNYVLNAIAEHPLSGNGFAKKIRFRDPIFVRTLTSHNIHNGFTSILYRAGIPLAIIYVSFFVFYFFKVINLIKATKHRHYLQPYAISAFVILLTMFIGQFTFQQYLARDFNFAGAIAIAMIGFVERNYNGAKKL